MVVGKDGGRWVLIGGNIAAAYLLPQMNYTELVRALASMARADTIMGGWNCCGGSKKRVLKEWT